jgi:hypothetical protein
MARAFSSGGAIGEGIRRPGYPQEGIVRARQEVHFS